MSRQKAHHTKQFKLDAINYRKEHPDLTQVECAKNLGIGVIPSLDGKPSFGIMAMIFQLLAQVAMLPRKRKKSLVSSMSSVMHRMHLMC